MDMRKTGSLLAAAASALCLAAALGCTSKTRYYIPEVMSFQPAQAAAGSTVVISGGDFSDVWSVSFGGEPAQYYKVNGNNQIIATVPDNAMSGSIVVQNPAGVGDSTFFGNKAFIVTPVITNVDPNSGPAGTVVTLTGSGFFGVTSVTIGSETPGQPGSSTFTYNDPNTVTVVVGSAEVPQSPVPVTLTASGVASAADPVNAVFTVTAAPQD